MSHELRTPLNSVIGFSGILEQGMAGPLNEEQTREVHMIRNAGSHLLTLVNDLLDLSQIESGKVVIDCASFELSRLVEELCAMIGPLAAERGLAFEIACASPEIVMHSDRLRLSQVLTNLLTNAVKFTVTGTVRLSCDDDAGDVVFRVTDTGIGIPPEEVPRIMEEFHQVDRPSDGMKPAGVGLGLAISHRLVKMLGGTLSIDSVLGAGTTFTVRVPIRSA
jgi:signal transduction histidine kinase